MHRGDQDGVLLPSKRLRGRSRPRQRFPPHFEGPPPHHCRRRPPRSGLGDNSSRSGTVRRRRFEYDSSELFRGAELGMQIAYLPLTYTLCCLRQRNIVRRSGFAPATFGKETNTFAEWVLARGEAKLRSQQAPKEPP